MVRPCPRPNVQTRTDTWTTSPTLYYIVGAAHDWASQRELFRQLVQKWHEERNEFSSYLSDIIACPSYLRIIGLGPTVVPFIFEQLQNEGDEPDHWGAALEAITGANPVHEGAYGDPVQIAEAWAEWYNTPTSQISPPLTIGIQARETGGTTVSLGQSAALTSGGSPPQAELGLLTGPAGHPGGEA
jgi:hypothetical protein